MAAATPFRSACIALALTLGLSGCVQEIGDDQPPERGDEAVAQVDGQTIWVSDVKHEAVAQGLIGEGEPLDSISDQFRQVLDEVVDQKLLGAEALKRKLDEDPLAQHRLASARDRILGDILVENVVAGAVTESNIRRLYDEQQKLAQRSDEIRARQIVVATTDDAEAIYMLLAAGASFEALAMERSTDSATRFNGGDLGYFTTDVMPAAYEAALQNAKPGQIVGPFAVEGGQALVKVEDRRLEQPITLEAARPQIVRFLTYNRIRDLLETLHGRADIQILIEPPEGAARSVPPDDAPQAERPATSVPPKAEGGKP